MDLLFIHTSYPSQLGRQAQILAADPGHRVVFATEQQDIDPSQIPARMRVVRIPRSTTPHRPSAHPGLQAVEEDSRRGAAVARVIKLLREQAFQPQLIIFHAGTGLGLFLKDCAPEATIIAYCEWYFQANDLPWIANSTSETARQSIQLKNSTLLQEILGADACVTPTEWQRSRFPQMVQPHLQVIFDGIDTQSIAPARHPLHHRNITLNGEDQTMTVPAGVPVMSYATRGMEPMRCFPELMRSLPHAMEAIQDLHVIIAGRDRQAYSYAAPSHAGSWKQHMLAELGDFEGRDRIHFMGLLPREELSRLLHRSDLHAYFSRPYVPSWSLLEAAAHGTPIAMNEGPATTGVLPNTAYVVADLESPQATSEILIKAIQESTKNNRQERRSQLPQKYELTHCLKQWETCVRNAIAKRRRMAAGKIDT